MLKLDRLREFGSVHPPEQLLCAGGKSIPVAHAEERPALYQAFERGCIENNITPVYKTRVYEQDGFSYDADGNLIEETMDLQARVRAKKMEAERNAQRAARLAHDQAMRDAGFAEGAFVNFEDAKTPRPLTANDVASNPNDGAVQEGAPKIGNDFDVVGWAQGRVDSPWFAVAKAIKEKYGFNPQTKAQALEWLVENGVVPAATVSA